MSTRPPLYPSVSQLNTWRIGIRWNENDSSLTSFLWKFQITLSILHLLIQWYNRPPFFIEILLDDVKRFTHFFPRFHSICTIADTIFSSKGQSIDHLHMRKPFGKCLNKKWRRPSVTHFMNESNWNSVIWRLTLFPGTKMRNTVWEITMILEQ